MRRYVFVQPSFGTRKRAAEPRKWTANKRHVPGPIEPPKEQTEIDTGRWLAALIDDDNMSISWDEWRRLDALNFVFPPEKWISMGTFATQGSLTQKRRFVCFWFKHIGVTTYKQMGVRYSKLTAKIFPIIEADAAWYKDIIVAHQQTLIFRDLRGTSNHWYDMLQRAGVVVPLPK